MLTANELRLLEELAGGSIELLEPSTRVDPDGARYPDAESFLPETSRVASTLRSLADRGLLLAEDERTVHICPECESERMRLRQLCVTCGSSETFRHEIIEHLSCGCTRPRAHFETATGDYVCPECERTLDALGIDYAKMGTQHICSGCDDQFDSPEHRFVCDGCEAVVSPADALELNVETYTFNEERREWLEGRLFIKRTLESRLRERGFTVTPNATVSGRSGREYPVHLHATDELLGIDLVVSIAECLNDESLTRLQMLGGDADAHPILVTLEESADDESLSILADQLDVTVIRPDEYPGSESAADDEASTFVEGAIEAQSRTSAD